MKDKRTYELSKRKYIDRLCSKERKHVGKTGQFPIMFVGDRGLVIGSKIKGFIKYGGFWKTTKNSLYTTVAITNEHNSSQTCLYYYQKLSHSMRIVQKKGKNIVTLVKGTFQCVNDKCISFLTKNACQSRDKLSALAIGLAGCSQLLFNATMPPFDPKPSTSNSQRFNSKAELFLNDNIAAA